MLRLASSKLFPNPNENYMNRYGALVFATASNILTLLANKYYCGRMTETTNIVRSKIKMITHAE